MYLKRQLSPLLHGLARSEVGRGIILTGARQTGKTTLLQREFVPEYAYHSFDEAFTRERFSRIPAADWIAQGKDLIFDEVQKSPAFLGTVKAVLDGSPRQRVILSGSAQISLLAGVRESLAGRVVTRELYPLMVSEIAGVDRPLLRSLLDCETSEQVHGLLGNANLSSADGQMAATRQALAHLLDWGGMPAVWQLPDDEQRRIWLEEYCQTYLQRDVADLGRVADLDDFFRFERISARRSAGLVNIADLARDAELSHATAKKYLRYLELSYQVFMLPARRRLRRGRPVKAARLHWVDIGVQRALSGLRAGLTGQQFETAMVAELYKLVRTLRLDVGLEHLRTHDGREVDLLLRLPAGSFLALEIKSSRAAAPHDARHLRKLEELLDAPVLAGLVVYQGQRLERWADNLYAVPAELLFSPAGD